MRESINEFVVSVSNEISRLADKASEVQRSLVTNRDKATQPIKQAVSQISSILDEADKLVETLG